jgi:chromatin remodeling complex protein RSC6
MSSLNAIVGPITTDSKSLEGKPLSKQASQQEKIIQRIDSIETALQTLKKCVELTLTEVKSLKKQAKKIKSQKQKKEFKGERKAHGFAVPSTVSDAMCIFMGVEPGTLISRTEVTKRLTQYITEHQLQNPKNKRQIIPNETLLNFLGEKAKDVYLTHFTIQKYLNQHFLLKEKKTVSEVTV